MPGERPRAAAWPARPATGRMLCTWQANSRQARCAACLAPFGRFLRGIGLDELPQIFNVHRGAMSLVGPRPGTPNEFAHYEPWQRERVNGLPGLTGYWQVSGTNKTTFNQMIAMYLFYLQNVSILLDLRIMLKPGAVIAGHIFESHHAAP